MKRTFEFKLVALACATAAMVLALPAAAQSGHSGMGSMGKMDMGPMQGGSPPPDARDPDAYAEGTTKHTMPGLHLSDDENFGKIVFNKLEGVRGRDERGQSLEAEAWYGGDLNKLWLKASAERKDGSLEQARTEVLWDRNFATFWSSQLGVRHDTGGGPSRNWLALGVQGLAPYWFETEATAYVGKGGSLAARLDLKYELLLTQQLILQPNFEANFYSRSDRERGIGSGLSDAEFGLRLRYEIQRQFAPYIGISWQRKFGSAADMARAAGKEVSERALVAGVRVWF